MKKLMFGLAALAAGSVMAIESANVVGYTELEIQPGLNMIGTSFLKCDGNGRPDLQAMFANAKTGCTAGEADGEADFIQIYDWTTKTYPNQFFFYAPHDPADADPDYDFKWCSNADYEPTDFTIPSASGFWYWNRGEKTVLMASGAVTPDSIEVTLKPGLNMVVNPFPCALDLNGTSVNWKAAGITAGEADGEADFIQIYDSKKKTYPNQFFFYAPHDPADADPDYDYKWCSNADYEPATFQIPVGGGFWYWNRGSEVTVTFKTPLAK